MPKIKVRGVKSYRSKQRVYHYHRATGIRIDIDLNAEPEQFLARVRELDMKAAASAASIPVALRDETLGGLFDAWKRSQEWNGLKPQTRATYERVIAPAVAFAPSGHARRSIGWPCSYHCTTPGPDFTPVAQVPLPGRAVARRRMPIPHSAAARTRQSRCLFGIGGAVGSHDCIEHDCRCITN